MKLTKQIALALVLVLISSGCFAFTTLAQRLMAVGGGGPTYVGPGDSTVVPGAAAFISVRSWTAAYASGSNNSVTTVTASGGEHCDFFIATNGNLGVAHNCSGGSNNATAATFCAISCTSVAVGVDQTGNGNNGVVYSGGGINVPSLNISTSPFTGFSTSFGCDNSSPQSWSLGSGVSTQLSTFTFVDWVKLTSTASTQGLFSDDQVGGRTWRILSGGQMDLSKVLGATLATSVGTVSTGTWHMLAVTWDNTSHTANFYVDGVPDSGNPNASGATATFTFGNFLICNGAGGIADMTGQMAEAMVYNSVLTPTQILALYNNAIANP